MATHVSDCSNLSLFLCACAVVPIAVQIADVAVGSPAAQAGVGAGQYVLSINDISISHLDQSAVDKQLAEAGGTVKLITMPGFIYEAQGAVLAKPVVFRLFSGCFSASRQLVRHSFANLVGALWRRRLLFRSFGTSTCRRSQRTENL